MNTQLTNLIAAARRLASQAASALDVRVDRQGLGKAWGNGIATLNGLCPQSSAISRNTSSHFSYQPCPKLMGERYQIGMHPGATPQVAGGFS
ncbi:hypothetical protein [Chitinimonas sp.]|uniref:hypothetical protein n=1 Tax=Chitinimonas sp. TaxID=1934313 RepID=UPI0035B046C0